MIDCTVGTKRRHVVDSEPAEPSGDRHHHYQRVLLTDIECEVSDVTSFTLDIFFGV